MTTQALTPLRTGYEHSFQLSLLPLMELPDHLVTKSSEELEDWFLSYLADPAPAMQDLALCLSHLRARGDQRSNSWSELLFDALASKRDTVNTMSLLSLVLPWYDNKRDAREKCRRILSGVFKDRLEAAFIRSIALDSNLPLTECIRRLELLTVLKPGLFCHDSTWGFGIVKKLDELYEKVIIDFDGKPEHPMSFAYAAEVLELVDDDHLLVRKHRDPDGLATQCKEDPAEVVKITLRSFGPLSAPLLQELLLQKLLSENEWKPFWEAARKKLKKDPLVSMPSKRNEPILLLQTEKAFDDQWFATLEEERSIPALIELITDLQTDNDTSCLPDAQKELLSRKLSFIIKGSEGAKPDMVARAFMLAARMDITVAEEQQHAMEHFFKPEPLFKALSELSVAEEQELLGRLASIDREKITSLLLSALNNMDLKPLNATLEFLITNDSETVCAESVSAVVSAKSSSMQMLAWLCKHMDWVHKHSVGSNSDIVTQAIDLLGKPSTHDKRKAQNQLRKTVENRAWLKTIFDGMTSDQRDAVVIRLVRSAGWDESQRRSFLARLIKMYPTLQDTLAKSAVKKAAPPQPSVKYTSWRTYGQRHQQLETLVKKTIPENSNEIAVARSYGDLRENFEYQAAKDRQRMLLQRKEDWERDLAEVKGSDFKDMTVTNDGMGGAVRISRPTGLEETFHVLGEWDFDDALSIVSCKSRIGIAFNARSVGDEVDLPGRNGDETCKITAISELPQHVKNWIVGK